MKQQQAQDWVETLTGAKFEGSFHESLKNGVKLCQCLNIIKAGTIKKIYEGTMAFKVRENIVNYLEGCKSLGAQWLSLFFFSRSLRLSFCTVTPLTPYHPSHTGMKETDCFVTQDLYEGDNMVVVIDQLFALGALSKGIAGFEGPYIGVKFSAENKREFSAEVTAAGACFVPQTSAGSVAVEKSKGTDSIVMYGKVGQEMGIASSEATQQTSGSIAVEKEKGTDSIVMYGKVGQEMGVASSEVNTLMGAIEVEKGSNQDLLTRATPKRQ